MKSIFLVRHAKSSWEDAATKDIDRPLNARGIKNAHEMATRLLAKAVGIDVFVSSPALRARTTAEHFLACFGKDKKALVIEDQLYLAPAYFFNLLISSIDNSNNSLAIFGHNPGITDFANTLTTVVRTDNIPTCGIFAVTAATDCWKQFTEAKKALLFYDYPKLLA